MSRIGKKPILMPSGVKIIRNQANLSVQGPKGTLSMEIPQGVEVALEDNAIIVKKTSEDRRARSYHGLTRTLVNNMITGVSAGFAGGRIFQSFRVRHSTGNRDQG
jgi:large subunit ribosomal protein L6